MKLLIYQNSELDFERSYAFLYFINSHSQVSDPGPKGLLLFLLLLFLSSQILSDGDSVTTGRIVLKFGDMVDMDVKLCNRVLKFKMSDSKAGPGACLKTAKLFPDYFSLSTEGIVLNFFLNDIY